MGTNRSRRTSSWKHASSKHARRRRFLEGAVYRVHVACEEVCIWGLVRTWRSGQWACLCIVLLQRLCVFARSPPEWGLQRPGLSRAILWRYSRTLRAFTPLYDAGSNFVCRRACPLLFRAGLVWVRWAIRSEARSAGSCRSCPWKTFCRCSILAFPDDDDAHPCRARHSVIRPRRRRSCIAADRRGFRVTIPHNSTVSN